MTDDDDDDLFFDTLEYNPSEKINPKDIDEFHKQIDTELLERIGNLPLDHKASDLTFIQALLEESANPNLNFESYDEKFGSNNSLLHKAVLCQNIDLAKMLLDYGANPKAKNSMGKNPIALVEASNKKMMDLIKSSLSSKSLDVSVSAPSSPTSTADIVRSLSPDDQSLLTDMVKELKLLRSEVANFKQQPRSHRSSTEVIEEEEIQAPTSKDSPPKVQEKEINSFDDLKENFSFQAMRSLIVKLAKNKEAQDNTEDQITNTLTTYLPRIVAEYTKAKEALDRFGPAVEEKKEFNKNRVVQHSQLSSKAIQIQSDIVAIYNYATKAKYPAVTKILEAEKENLPPIIKDAIIKNMAAPNPKNLEAQRKMANTLVTRPPNPAGLMADLKGNLLKRNNKKIQVR